MDAPPIPYARTSDGVNIAYWTLGSGFPVVHIHIHVASQLDLEWEIPAMRSWYESMAHDYQVIRLNLRGGGLSDRMTEGLGLDAYVSDLEAVMDAIGIERAALLSASQSAVVPVRYARLHPERVQSLVLFNPALNSADIARNLAATTALAQADHGTWATTMAKWIDPVQNDPDGLIARMVSVAVSAEMQPHLIRAYADADATSDAEQITAPTLIIGMRDNARTEKSTRATAVAIPHARLVMEPGTSMLPYFESAEAIQKTVRAFLDQDTAAPDSAGRDDTSPSPTPFRTILFTDLESSTALTQKLGDDKAQEILHGHNEVVRAALAAHGGEEVKHTGDGIMATFGSAVSGVQAALQIQRDLAGGEIRVRIGLNAGEPIAEDRDYFGTSVQLAARLCDRAEPGQVLVSNVVRELCAGKTFTFQDLGSATLKGFDDPVVLYAVGVE